MCVFLLFLDMVTRVLARRFRHGYMHRFEPRIMPRIYTYAQQADLFSCEPYRAYILRCSRELCACAGGRGASNVTIVANQRSVARAGMAHAASWRHAARDLCAPVAQAVRHRLSILLYKKNFPLSGGSWPAELPHTPVGLVILKAAPRPPR